MWKSNINIKIIFIAGGQRKDVFFINELTRIFHTVSTDAAQSCISTALRLFGRLDILSNMSALPALRAPCIYARLRALDTKRYEISGLIQEKIKMYITYCNFSNTYFYKKIDGFIVRNFQF